MNILVLCADSLSRGKLIREFISKLDAGLITRKDYCSVTLEHEGTSCRALFKTEEEVLNNGIIGVDFETVFIEQDHKFSSECLINCAYRHRPKQVNS